MNLLAEMSRPANPKSRAASDPGDLHRAKATDARLAATDRALSPREVSERCERAVESALPGVSEPEREALAQELVIYLQRRFLTWTPLRSQLRWNYLRRKAVGLAGDLRSWADTGADESLDLEPDPEHSGGVLADMTAAPLPHSDPAWRECADALGCRKGRSDADAVYAALSGYKPGDLAEAQNRTPDAAKQRLAEGRKAIRERVGTPDGLVAALARAACADAPRLDGEGPLAALSAGNGERKPHAAKIVPVERVPDDKLPQAPASSLHRGPTLPVRRAHAPMPGTPAPSLTRRERVRDMGRELAHQLAACERHHARLALRSEKSARY